MAEMDDLCTCGHERRFHNEFVKPVGCYVVPCLCREFELKEEGKPWIKDFKAIRCMGYSSDHKIVYFEVIAIMSDNSEKLMYRGIGVNNLGILYNTKPYVPIELDSQELHSI